MSIDFSTLMQSVVISSFFLMNFIEMASFGSRVAGRVLKRVALGTTLQHSIFTASRIFLVIFLPALGYIVESGINLQNYLIIVIVSFSLSFISSIYLLIKLNIFQIFFQNIFRLYAENTIPFSFFKALILKNQDTKLRLCNSFSMDKIIWKKALVSCFAYLFLISSYFLAFTLAIVYPENRLTLSQFTGFFHIFGAIVMAFYLDPMLSRSIDNFSEDSIWLENTYSILVGRSLSYLILVLVLIFILYFFLI